MSAGIPLERFADVRILCIGDVMLDRFVHGRVTRISPEAPIPVLRIANEALMPGGTGNVAANVAALGGTAVTISVVGRDEAGGTLADLMEKQPGLEARLVTAADRETTVKIRYVAGGQHLLRADRESGHPLAEATAARLIEVVGECLPGCGAVVLSDYAKGVLTPAVIGAIVAAARSAGVPVIVDPKGRDLSRYSGAAVVTPNRRELAEAMGSATDTDAAVADAAGALARRDGLATIVVTRSEQGMSVVGVDGPAIHLPARAREVYDVSGAGDTVAAVLALGLAVLGRSDARAVAEAAEMANLAAGVVVGKIGTATVSPEELAAAVHAADWSRGEAKIHTLAAAQEIVGRWRRAGGRVAFTNGCFDLLHPGHISLLRQARAACDRLVVGLNSDASVRRLKGDDRPVQSEASRAAVLASLTDVDMVVIFDEDTPLRLIDGLRPDLLVKGADYTVETVVGADRVQSWGGSILLADLQPGHSTTATIARLRPDSGNG